MERTDSADSRDELIGLVRQWIIPKLESREGFSVLLVSAHPDGNKATKYQEESVESALASCRQDLRTHLADASAYALVYDARMQMEAELRSVLIFQTEARGRGTAACLAEFYRLRPDEHEPARPQFQSDGMLHHLEDEAPWLAPRG